MNLWLDDQRPAPEGFTWVKTVKEAIALLSTGQVEFASLDYDIAWDPGGTDEDWENRRTGMGVVLWMEENRVWPRRGVVVHSMNPVGAKRMQARLKDFRMSLKPCEMV